MTKRTIAKVTGIVLGALVLLELVYVSAAKLALKKLPELASYDALQITYSDAGSWIPGRVWVRDFVVSGHDTNIQFEVRVKEAQLTVNLLDLASKHFHATRAVTSGVEFRMRHNVERLAGQEQRIASFAEIRGYEGPPVYADKPDGPSGPPEDAWLIQMENVSAQVDDVWVVEYHYAGKGTAKGGFKLDPGKAFHLDPSEFVWEGGELAVGDTLLSRETKGKLRSEMHLDDVQKIHGFDFADKVKVDLELALRAGQLAFLDVYSGLPLKRVSGEYSAVLRLLAENGKVLEGTEFKGKFKGVKVTADGVSVATDAVIDVGAKHDAEEQIVHLVPLNASFTDAVIDFNGDRSKQFSAIVTSSSARWLTDKPATALQATVDARVKPGDALLEAALGKTPAAITDAFLDLPQIDTRVALYLTKGKSRVELLHLDAGDLEASGAWQDRPLGGTGGFTVKTSLVDIGVALDRNRVSWDLE